MDSQPVSLSALPSPTAVESVVYEQKQVKYVVPRTSSSLHGYELLRNPKFNKGLGFTHEERRALHLEGLLPEIVKTQEEQMANVMSVMRAFPTDFDRYLYIMQLADRNERLFYRCLMDNVTELLPVVYTPTVGQACQKFAHIFKNPRGMYISLRHKGRVEQILANWPDRVRAIVFTDGERILGLGDLGACGMGIPIGKLALYTACAGVDPSTCLPVTIDVGTNNESLLADPKYTGLRQKRCDRKEYDDLIDEFITAARKVFGEHTLLQFEDFGNNNAFRLLDKYKDACCTFNDDIQGTASVVLAGVYAGLRPTNKSLKEHTFLFYGAGSAGIGIANLIAYAMSVDENLSLEEARKRIWLVDSKGLIYKGRQALNHEKEPYAHEFNGNPASVVDLADIVDAVKPTAIFGVTAMPQTFTEAVCKNMCKYSERPLIFALSNPTSKAECTAEQAYTFTDGKCLFASGSPFAPVELKGQVHVPGQGNNSYIFPGLSLGVLTVGARRVTDHMFYVAAKTLAKMVDEKQIANGTLYPPLKDIRVVSAAIATAVADDCYRTGLATLHPKPDNMLQFITDSMYDTTYPTYV